ncbi:myo-inositol-1(or 4)-monophosphatase [Crossiella equi]|uniref:Myo-inositol-1(Or 4)-monophosphatase n=1 Tax=Crossiella equi TaxID=130796 RepID=A0ABS5A4L3_9PSEU|nr:inositol monophosphatase family protein [Crossiella equi]MBP2471509.1 myo-inositol-1(or 4)-monophosphatase [Crossiella equi]
MSDTTSLPNLAASIAELVRSAMLEIRPRLVEAALSGNRGEHKNERHSDNFLSDYDLWMHQHYKEALTEHLSSFVYASEEADPEVIGPEADPDLCVLVDPLDTSELAVRSLYGYTHVMVYSRQLARPILAVIGDIFHHNQLYIGARDESGTDRAFLVTADLVEHSLTEPSQANLSQALVTNYLMRPSERFSPLAQQGSFLEALSAPSGDDGKRRGRIGVDFGSVSLCHVAAGLTDASVEFAKGFAIWDLLPGHYVLHAAGGTLIDLQGKPIALDYNLGSLESIAAAMNPRQKFIAAGNPRLADEILRSLHV